MPIEIVPANQAGCEELTTIFGTAGTPPTASASVTASREARPSATIARRADVPGLE